MTLRRSHRGKLPRRLIICTLHGQAGQGRALQGTGRTVHGHTHISALQGWCVVDTIPSHAHHVAPILQDLHDGVLVLGEHLSEAVCVLHQLVHILHALQVDDALLGLCTRGDVSTWPLGVVLHLQDRQACSASGRQQGS